MHDQTADSEREGIITCGASRLIVLMSFSAFLAVLCEKRSCVKSMYLVPEYVPVCATQVAPLLSAWSMTEAMRSVMLYNALRACQFIRSGA